MYRRSKNHLQRETRRLTSLRPKEPAEAEPTARGWPVQAWAGTSLVERVEDRWDELQGTPPPSCPYSIPICRNTIPTTKPWRGRRRLTAPCKTKNPPKNERRAAQARPCVEQLEHAFNGPVDQA